MRKVTGYCDLCIPWNKNINELKKTLYEAVRLGYKVVAIDEVYDDKVDRNANKAARGNDFFPKPFQSDELDEFQSKLTILSRLTIAYGDCGISHPMNNSANLKMYDIIAGRPTTESAINHCCSTLACDLISLSIDESDLYISRKNYSIAIRRGLYFEIQYAPAIIDSNYRRKTIVRSHKYHVSGKSKHIILTSGATKAILLRSPYDMANLGLIFGLSEEQSKHSMLGCCRDLVLRAQGRRIGKTILWANEIAAAADSDDDDDSTSDSSNSSGDEMDEDDSEIQPPKRLKIN